MNGIVQNVLKITATNERDVLEVIHSAAGLPDARNFTIHVEPSVANSPQRARIEFDTSEVLPPFFMDQLAYKFPKMNVDAHFANAIDCFAGYWFCQNGHVVGNTFDWATDAQREIIRSKVRTALENNPDVFFSVDPQSNRLNGIERASLIYSRCNVVMVNGNNDAEINAMVGVPNAVNEWRIVHGAAPVAVVLFPSIGAHRFYTMVPDANTVVADYWDELQRVCRPLKFVTAQNVEHYNYAMLADVWAQLERLNLNV